jgi:hypothetical protein
MEFVIWVVEYTWMVFKGHENLLTHEKKKPILENISEYKTKLIQRFNKQQRSFRRLWKITKFYYLRIEKKVCSESEKDRLMREDTRPLGKIKNRFGDNIKTDVDLISVALISS